MFEVWVRRKDGSQWCKVVTAKDPDHACHKMVRDKQMIPQAESVSHCFLIGDSTKSGIV